MNRLALWSLALVLGTSQAASAADNPWSYTFVTVAGSAGQSGTADGTNDTVRFLYPGAVAVGPAGEVYAADNSHTIRLITHVGGDWVVRVVAGAVGASGTADGTNTDAKFMGPGGMVVDGAGNLFVTDNYTIRQVTRSGTNWIVNTIAGKPGTSGNVDGTNSDARFNGAYGIGMDAAGNLYVTDSLNATVRRLSPTGTNWIVTTLAGGYGTADGTNRSGRFVYPTGLAVDAANNVYVTDSNSHTIRKLAAIDTNWVVTTIVGQAGSFGSTDGTNNGARFYDPESIAVDASGRIYVADTGNNVVRGIAISGTNYVVTTVAGLAGTGAAADGTGNQAHFNWPWAIATNPQGDLFVADTGNDTIRFGQFLPRLQFSVWNQAEILSWPLLASNFVLETATTLDTAISWQPLTNGVTTSADEFVVTNQPSASPAFYRLRRN